MLIPPAGRDPRNKENERTANDAVRRAVQTVQTRPSGSGAGTLTGPASQGTGLVASDGTSLLGTLGFALGFSGIGGDDWLYPPDREIEVPVRFFSEIY